MKQVVFRQLLHPPSLSDPYMVQSVQKLLLELGGRLTLSKNHWFWFTTTPREKNPEKNKKNILKLSNFSFFQNVLIEK